MTAWSVELTNRALRDLAGLDRPVARRVTDKIERARDNTYRFFARMRGSDDYKLRVGDYRVIAALLPDRSLIIIKRIGHRSDIYRR